MVDNFVVTQSAAETKSLGEKIGRDLVAGRPTGGPTGSQVLALYGELGSGKTTFVQGLAKGLGIQKRILSPTFVFVRQYPINGGHTFYHVDLYRIASLADAKGLGLEEIMAEPKSVVAIEWAEKIKKLLPKKRIDVHFNYLGDNERKIICKSS